MTITETQTPPTAMAEPASTGLPTAPPAMETRVPPTGEDSEPSTPLVVRLSMDYAPKLDEEIDLLLEIRAYRDAPGTTARIELPTATRLVSGSPTWAGDIAAGTTERLAVRIAFTAEGQYTVNGIALRPVTDDNIWGDDDQIYLTVTKDAGSFGFVSGGQPQVTAGPIP